MDCNYISNTQTILESFYDFENATTRKNILHTIREKFTKDNPPKVNIESVLLELKNNGILESDSNVNLENRFFFITSKGINILLNGGVKKYFEDLDKKEKLEFKLLESSVNSHMLNIFQLIVTIILAIGTTFGLYFQYESMKSQKKVDELEIIKLKNEINKLR